MPDINVIKLFFLATYAIAKLAIVFVTSTLSQASVIFATLRVGYRKVLHLTSFKILTKAKHSSLCFVCVNGEEKNGYVIMTPGPNVIKLFCGQKLRLFIIS